MDRFSDMDLVGRAEALGRASANVSSDLGALLFPKSGIAISDRMISKSRQYLHKIITDIESQICQNAIERGLANHEILAAIATSEYPQSIDLLEQSGVFEDDKILDHLFHRAQLGEIRARLLQKVSQQELEASLTANLDHPNRAIAEAAMALLVAQNRIGSDDTADMIELPAEILFQLVWPIVAVLEKKSGYNGAALIEAAEQLLAEHDESESTQTRAARLAALLEQDENANVGYPHPLKDGIELSLARLAYRSGLTADQCILFTAEANMARLVMTLRALNIPADEALSIFAAFDGSNGLLTAASYNEIALEKARMLVEQWSRNPDYQKAASAISASQSDGL